MVRFLVLFEMRTVVDMWQISTNGRDSGRRAGDTKTCCRSNFNNFKSGSQLIPPCRYFKKSENYHPSPEYTNVNKDNHGSGGPIHTSHKGFSVRLASLAEIFLMYYVGYQPNNHGDMQTDRSPVH